MEYLDTKRAIIHKKNLIKMRKMLTSLQAQSQKNHKTKIGDLTKIIFLPFLYEAGLVPRKTTVILRLLNLIFFSSFFSQYFFPPLSVCDFFNLKKGRCPNLRQVMVISDIMAKM